MKKRDSNNQPDNLGFSKRLSNQTGAAMIEYGLLVALLGLSLCVAAAFVVDETSAEFERMATAMDIEGQ